MEPKLTGYVTTSLGFIKNASENTIPVAVAGLGARIENNGFYAQAEGGYGGATYVKAELGKDFDLSDNGFGLNTSIGGQYTTEHTTRNYYTATFDDKTNNSPTWKNNDTRGYGQVALTYKNSIIEAELGLRAGVKTSTQPSLDGITLDAGQTEGTEYAGRTTKGLIEPAANIGVNFGSGWKIALQATPSQSSVGLSLNF